MSVYPIDKPLGLTSHDVVARARRQLGTRRVGHAGTLDPLATGVLVVLANESTKLSPYLTASRKRYLAWVAFGAGTPTLDAEGPVDTVADPADLAHLYAEKVAAAAARFEGPILQRPPAYSAIKQQGERSYAAARRGAAAEPPARPAHYYEVQLLAFARNRALLPDRFARTPAGWRPDPAGRSFDLPPTLTELPTALLALEVGAGTYVRSFARDLGEALGLPAHLAGLVRTGAGNVDLADCAPLEALGSTPGLTPLAALDLPRLAVDAATALALRQGKRALLPVAELTVTHEADGALVALVEPRTDENVAGEAAQGTGSVRPVRIVRAWQR